MAADLEDARTKLAWAEDQREALDQELRAFFRRMSLSLRGGHAPELAGRKDLSVSNAGGASSAPRGPRLGLY